MQTELQTPKSSLTISDVIKYFRSNSTRLNVQSQDMTENCIQIVQKPANNRTREEEELLVSMLRELNFFGGVTQDDGKGDKMLLNLTKVLEYEVIPAGNPVCHKNEVGTKFYLVLKGEAIVFTELLEECFNNTDETSNSQMNSKQDNTSQQSLLYYAEGEKQTKKNSPILFQPKIIKRNLTKLISQGSVKLTNKKFSRSNLPQATWDVDRALASIPLNKFGTNNEEIFRNFEKDYIEMLLEYKLLEEVATKFPGKYIRDGHFLYKAAKKLKEGDYFGELALITNKPRNATVVASQDLHCLTISKKAYQDVSMKSCESINPNIKFLQEFFPDASKVNLAKLAYLVEEQHYVHNQVIFEEDDDPDGVYFIKEGEVQILKRIKCRGNISAREYEGAKKKKNIITTIGKGEVLGEDEVLYGKIREYTALVSSREAVIFKMEKKVYDSLNNTYKSLFNNIKKLSKVKTDYRYRLAVQGEAIAESINEFKPKLKAFIRQGTSPDPTYDLSEKFSTLMGNISSSLTKSRRGENRLKTDRQTPLNSSEAGITPFQKFLKDKLVGGSKEFLKRVYYREKDENEKSKDLSRSPNNRTENPYEVEGKSYILRLDTKIDTLTPENDEKVIEAKSPDEYMINNTAHNLAKKLPKSLQTKREGLRKIITGQINIQSLQKSPRKDLGISATLRNDSSINNSEDESPALKESEPNSFSNLKKAWRPPTSGGYYSVKRENLVSHKIQINQMHPSNNVTLLGRLHGLKTTREKIQGYESAGNLSARLTSTRSTERRDTLMKPRVSPREPDSESNVLSGTTFVEYFKGFPEKEELIRKKTVITPKRLATSQGMVRVKARKDFGKERKDASPNVTVTTDQSLVIQKLTIKPK